jgi:hypothetical protein
LGQSARNLMNVKLRYYDKSRCNNVFEETLKDWNSQICAGDVEGTKDTCKYLRRFYFICLLIFIELTRLNGHNTKVKEIQEAPSF